MKVSYLDQPHIEPRPELDEVELTADAFIIIDNIKKYAPMRYKYNGASIPRIFWSIIGSPFDPDFAIASLFHDIVYLTHALSRAVADEMFYQLLLLCGVPRWKARLMWAAVRSCAAFAWENTAADEIDLKNLIGDIKARNDDEKFGWLLKAAA